MSTPCRPVIRRTPSPISSALRSMTSATPIACLRGLYCAAGCRDHGGGTECLRQLVGGVADRAADRRSENRLTGCEARLIEGYLGGQIGDRKAGGEHMVNTDRNRQ